MGANAVTTVPVYVAGEVLTAADLNITNSGIPVFDTSVERDAAFGGTGEKTLAEGQFAYLETGNVTQYYDGSNWVSVGVAPGLVLIKTQTVGTAVSSVNVTGAFSATYDRYLITASGGSSTNNRTMGLTLGATSTGYYDAGIYVTYPVSTVTGENNSNGSNFTAFAYAALLGLGGRIEINNPFNTVRTEVITQFGAMVTNSEFTVAGGFLDNATSYTDFTLTMAGAGTMTGGTIYVYGYAKA
jgi:hypothetical protein